MFITTATKTIYNTLLYALLVVFVSCSSSDDNTIPTPIDDEPEENPNPIPTKISTYTADVKAIIDAECIRCHSNPPINNAPISLVTFQDVVFAANSRDLTGLVSTTIERVLMPPDTGRLPQGTIDIILDWEADGLLE